MILFVLLIYLLFFFYVVHTIAIQELKQHCENCGLSYRFVDKESMISSAALNGGKKEKKTLADQGVDVVFRISIPSIERSALLMQSTGTYCLLYRN